MPMACSGCVKSNVCDYNGQKTCTPYRCAGGSCAAGSTTQTPCFEGTGGLVCRADQCTDGATVILICCVDEMCSTPCDQACP
jgi:hypothetical protein